MIARLEAPSPARANRTATALFVALALAPASIRLFEDPANPATIIRVLVGAMAVAVVLLARHQSLLRDAFHRARSDRRDRRLHLRGRSVCGESRAADRRPRRRDLQRPAPLPLSERVRAPAARNRSRAPTYRRMLGPRDAPPPDCHDRLSGMPVRDKRASRRCAVHRRWAGMERVSKNCGAFYRRDLHARQSGDQRRSATR